MAQANPVKGEVEVKTSAGVVVVCFPWGVQKAIGAKFNKPFRQFMAEDLPDLSDDDFEFVWRLALSHRQPGLKPEATADLIGEVGFTTCSEALAESLRLAFDIPAPAAGEAAPADAGPPEAPTGA